MKGTSNRRIVWGAIVLLGMLNLLVGGMAYVYLGQVAASYSLLLGEGIPFLNDMQTATAQASRSYALLVDISEADMAADVARFELELASVRAVSERIFSSPKDKTAVPADLKINYDEILTLREQGAERLKAFLALVHEGNRTEASAKLHREIYPAHKVYLGKLDHFCDQYQEKFAALNRKLSDENSFGRSLLVGFSAVPLAVLIGMAVVTLITLLSMLFMIARS